VSEESPEHNDSLPALNSRQERFVLALLEGKSSLDAYKSAGYGKGSTDTSCKVNAAKLKAHSKIRKVLQYYQRLGQDYSRVTLEEHLAQLARGRELAYELGQASAGIQAEHYRGKAAGLYTERTQLDVNVKDETLVSQLAAFFGQDLASTVAEALAGKAIDAEVVEIKDTTESRLLAKPSVWEEEHNAE
jgi:hypothetical protein